MWWLFSRQSAPKVRKSAISEKQGSNYRNLAKLAWNFSLATETLLKKDRTIETFLAAKMTSSIFSYKNSTGAIYLKIGRIIDFDVKKSEIKFQTGSAIFDEDMTSSLTRVIFY